MKTICGMDAGARGVPMAMLPVFGQERDPLLLAVVPDPGAGRRAIIFLLHSDPDLNDGLDALREAYGLTPMEAKLARHVGCAVKLEDAAVLLGITKGTAHAYLREVFRKIGVSRQSELARRIATSIDRLNLPEAPGERQLDTD